MALRPWSRKSTSVLVGRRRLREELEDLSQRSQLAVSRLRSLLGLAGRAGEDSGAGAWCQDLAKVLRAAEAALWLGESGRFRARRGDFGAFWST